MSLAATGRAGAIQKRFDFCVLKINFSGEDNMKNKTAAVFAAATVLLMSGCSGKTPPEVSGPKSALPDGRYTATWDLPDAEGYREYIIFDITNSKPEITEFSAKDEHGILKSADPAMRDRMVEENKAAGRPEMFHQRAYAQILENYRNAGGDISAVENVSGATRSSASFKALVKEFERAENLDAENSVLTLPYYEDGTYRITSPVLDAYGHREYIVLTVTDGVPTVTQAGADTPDRVPKAQNSEVVSPIDFESVYQNLTDAANDPDRTVEIVAAGATRTAKEFEALYKYALDSAHLRRSKTGFLPMFADGEYTARLAHPDEYGYVDFLEISVRDGVPEITAYDSKNSDGDLKSEDAALFSKMGGSRFESYAEMQKALIDAFYRADRSVLEIENVAGATVSCNNFKLLAGQLLYHNAANGITSTAAVTPFQDTAEQ